MSIGSVDILVVKFPGKQFRGDFGDLAPALRELVEGGLVRVIDLLLIRKDSAGNVEKRELTSLAQTDFELFKPLVDQVLGLLSDDDVTKLADMLDNDSAGAIMMFENVWSARFRDSLLAAGGELVFNERAPRSVVEKLNAPGA